MKVKSFTKRSFSLLATTIILLAAWPVTIAGALDASSGFIFANETVAVNSVTDPNNGWTSNNLYAIFNNAADTVDYGLPTISLPANATIAGIEVLVEGRHTVEGDLDFTAALWNTSALEPDAYTSSKTAAVGTADTMVTLGGPTDKWGTTWTIPDFADATFRLRIGVTGSTGNADLDSVSVKVYYSVPTPTITTLSPLSPATYGTPVTFTATVSPTPTEGLTVNFYDGPTLLGSGTTSSGVASYTTTATQLKAISSPHAITAVFTGDSSFAGSTSGGALQTISPRPLTVSAAGMDKVYDGITLASVTLSTDALPGDDVSVAYISAAFADPNVGTGITVTVSGISISGADAGNYSLLSNTTSTTASITPRPIQVTPNPGQGKVYGEPDPLITFTSEPLAGSDTFTGTLGREAGENIGTYNITLGTLSAGSNYTLSLAPATFVITVKDLTVTANDKSKRVGEPDPVFDFTATGFAFSDTFFVPPTCGVLTAHDTPGTYEIACSGGDAGANYNLLYVPGTLTVNAANEAPTDILLSSSSVDENKPIGTVVGSLSTTDPNAGDTFTYAFCGGADDGSFSLDGSTLQTAAIFDYETKNSYSICIRSTDQDALNINEIFTISVNNLPDQATFADVPLDYWAWQYIEAIYRAGITGGCGTNPLMYCPTDPVTRDQMAVFLLKGIHGSSYTPPPATGTVFDDVPADYWAAAWIEQLAAEGVTAGCGSSNYCPLDVVTRDQMAVFLLRAKHTSSYTPPVAAGTVFSDVPVDYWAAAWIEQLAVEGVTAGCGNNNYCPLDAVTRDQMAVFLQRTFSLPLPSLP